MNRKGLLAFAFVIFYVFAIAFLFLGPELLHQKIATKNDLIVFALPLLLTFFSNVVLFKWNILGKNYEMLRGKIGNREVSSMSTDDLLKTVMKLEITNGFSETYDLGGRLLFQIFKGNGGYTLNSIPNRKIVKETNNGKENIKFEQRSNLSNADTDMLIRKIIRDTGNEGKRLKFVKNT